MNESFKISFLLLISTLVGCIGAGTHGSLENYQFPISKYSLELVIDEVINTTPNIYRDTVKRYSFVDVTDGKNDTIWDTYYRDTINYETIYIETEDDRVQFIFRYYGNDELWNKSADSGIFICYAYDKHGQGGSEGMGNISSKTQTRGHLKIIGALGS